MIRIGMGFTSPELIRGEEASGFPSWALLRLLDLAAQVEFLEPLKLVLIDDYRNTPSCNFL